MFHHRLEAAAMILSLLTALVIQATEIKADLAYIPGASDFQKLDLYLPAKRPFKTIMFAYGGGWHGGSRKNMAPIGKRFQELGYGCAMISYRLTPPNKWPAHINDAADAATWVLKHIGDYGGDAKQVWLAGHSSGAQLVVLLATDSTWLATRNVKPTDFKGVIGISTPVDLEPHNDMTFGDALMGGAGADPWNRNVDAMKYASPINHIKGAIAPPLLLMAGDSDMPGLSDGGKRFAAQAKQAGMNVRFETIKDRNHMSIMLGLLKDGDPALKLIQSFIGK
jgi:acetyl esterase/lipase